MKELMKRLAAAGFVEGQMRENEKMARHTTMRVGGPADLLVEPDGEAQLASAFQIARALGVPYMVLGGGSNLIVRDRGVRGMVVKLSDRMGGMSIEGNRVTAQAGARLSGVAGAAQKAGLGGFEFAAGIPGTVGGAVLMNAGAYGGEIKDVLVSAKVLEDGAVRVYDNTELEFGYRASRVMKSGGVIVEAVFELIPDAPEEIARRMADLAARRRDKQPLNFPSSGSTFKRPEGHFAGALIENAGFKGFALGGAKVSEKHAGFVVNHQDATAADVTALIEQVRAAVYAHSGVTLELEVRIVGEE